jgi:hypothetical protein
MTTLTAHIIFLVAVSERETFAYYPSYRAQLCGVSSLWKEMKA